MHRYRLPDKVKERQAEELKRRFAAYGRAGKTQNRSRGKATTVAVLVFLAVWLFFSLR